MKILRNMLKGKRGVSPLIATVLLIAFTVALGAVVMNWGRSYVEETAAFSREKSTTEIKCSTDVRLEFLKIRGINQVCYNETTTGVLNFTIENTGTLDIYGLQVNIIGDLSINTTEINLENNTIKRAQIYKGNVSYPISGTDDVGTIQQVKIVPKTKIEGNIIACPTNALIEEDVKKC